MIGTDPAQATVLHERDVEIPAHLGINPAKLCDGKGGKVVTKTKFAFALGAVVQKTAEKWYEDNKIPPSRRDRMNGSRRPWGPFSKSLPTS